MHFETFFQLLNFLQEIKLIHSYELIAVNEDPDGDASIIDIFFNEIDKNRYLIVESNDIAPMIIKLGKDDYHEGDWAKIFSVKI